MMIINKLKTASSGQYYRPGGQTRYISDSHLRDIRSRVTTHEGEVLKGSKGERYLDKYSKQYKGKDMSKSYLDRHL